MSRFSAIDLSQLPSPDLIEVLDYETILAALKADLTARAPELAEALALESEPLVKLLEVAAYRETILRARVNDAARGVMLAYATGTDLDQLGAWWGVTRQAGESDTDFRAAIQASLEAHTTAGSLGSYRWHALRADPGILDVGISSPIPGTVLAAVVGAAGTPTTEELDAVEAALNAEDVRPLCDTVRVEAATLAAYDVTATLHLAHGPDAATVLAAALDAVQAYTQASRTCGTRLARSALFSALQQPGVLWVDLVSPAADIVTDEASAPWPGALTLTYEQADA